MAARHRAKPSRRSLRLLLTGRLKPWLFQSVRTRPILLTALCCLGTIAPVVGAPAAIRDQVAALLTQTASEPLAPEVSNARKQAKEMLDRAGTARQSKDPDAAQLGSVFDETALEWAQLSKDLVELAALQAKADAAEKEQGELEAQLKREKAHLEETEARRGRALATLEKLGKAQPETAPVAPTSQSSGGTP